MQQRPWGDEWQQVRRRGARDQAEDDQPCEAAGPGEKTPRGDPESWPPKSWTRRPDPKSGPREWIPRARPGEWTQRADPKSGSRQCIQRADP
uniref:Uncharacterized protein n=1 Tax=Knipowitschia caucasica TaxID=637954 RepID=A0AAV2LQ33_KNICA